MTVFIFSLVIVFPLCFCFEVLYVLFRFVSLRQGNFLPWFMRVVGHFGFSYLVSRNYHALRTFRVTSCGFSYLGRYRVLTLMFGRFTSVFGRCARPFFGIKDIGFGVQIFGMYIGLQRGPQVSRHYPASRGGIATHSIRGLLYPFNAIGISIYSCEGTSKFSCDPCSVMVGKELMVLLSYSTIGNSYHHAYQFTSFYGFGNVCTIVVPALTSFCNCKCINGNYRDLSSFSTGPEVFRRYASTTI